MRGITQILVVINSEQTQQLALNRAVQFCRVSGAALHILAPDPKFTPTSLAKLERLSAPLLEEGLEVYSHVLWQKNITETILHTQQITHCNLIIKDISLSKTWDLFKTPTDWDLLRHSRIPVLLVQTEGAWEQVRMLAAIDANPNDCQHAVMNHAILDYTNELAMAFSADIYLTSAYPTTHLAARSYEDSITEHDAYKRVCMEHVREFHLNENNLFIEAGPAETLIPNLIKQSKIRLLVLGTHARKGLSALAIGNTAEQLLTKVNNTDILVIPPQC